MWGARHVIGLFDIVPDFYSRLVAYNDAYFGAWKKQSEAHIPPVLCTRHVQAPVLDTHRRSKRQKFTEALIKPKPDKRCSCLPPASVIFDLG